MGMNNGVKIKDHGFELVGHVIKLFFLIRDLFKSSNLFSQNYILILFFKIY